jgi:hypothetical protein
MFYWIYDHPPLLVAMLFTLAFMAFGVIGLLIFLRVFHGWLHKDERTNEMVGFAMTSFALLHGLLLGLLAVAAYNNYAEKLADVTAEAASLAALYRDVGGFPEPTRSELQDTLRQFTRSVIDVSWPLQREGQMPSEAPKIMGQLFDQMYAFEPADDRDAAVLAEALAQANTLVTLQRTRLAGINEGIPVLMWWVVVIGTVINIMLIWMVNGRKHIHVMLTGLLSGFMGLVIFLIAAMDHPFRGDVSVGPEAIEEVYQTMMLPAPPAGAASPAINRPEN